MAVIDPNDLRPGVRIHAPEVFLKSAVQGPLVEGVEWVPSDRPIRVEALADMLRIPIVEAIFEPFPVFRSWLVLVGLAGMRAELDAMEAGVQGSIAALLAAGVPS